MAENIQNNENIEMTEQELNEIIAARREKLNGLVAAGKNPYEEVKFDKTHSSKQIKDNFAALEGKDVIIAGKILSRRLMGKASFCHILDGEGEIQLYVRSEDVDYEEFKKYDIGDIIGAGGFVFKTKTGEISVHLFKTAHDKAL
jgi:lysyl-tRNA synthetase class 2